MMLIAVSLDYGTAQEGGFILEIDISAVFGLIDHAQSCGLDILSRDLHRARRGLLRSHGTKIMRARFCPRLIVDKAGYEKDMLCS